jgi:ribosomal protein S18 acetylase RimI-like enzyme
VEAIEGRDAVVAAAGGHPFALYYAVGTVRGHRSGTALAWHGRSRAGSWVAATGEPRAVLDLLLATDLHADAGWIHLPRTTPEQAAPLGPASIHDDWDFLVTSAAPPSNGVVARELDPSADAAVDALLDVAFPDSMARPGDGRVRRWYGVHEGGELVATAADRSRGGVGYIAGVAVHPDHRRRGLGTAVTAELTRALLAEFPAVTLGVMADAVETRRVYERLGYGGHLPRTSLRISR